MIKHFTRESNRGCSCAFRWVIYISSVDTVQKTQCACTFACMHVWNQDHTPHIHWRASIQKRKLAVVLLMHINYAALQRDNDYNQISCFKASRSGKKITPFTPPTAHAPNPSSTPWATLFIFHILRHAGDLGNFLPAYACDHMSPSPVVVSFGKMVTFILSKRH